MTSTHFRQSLVALTFAWIGVIAFATHLLVSAEISRREREFEESIQHLSSQLKNKLDMNDAVLAGFSAFLQAVEGNDVKSATRYAASALASYPHIYMLEVARRVPVEQEEQFQATLRKEWLGNFTLKIFPGALHNPPANFATRKETWPILFMYPALPEAQEIYGVRLETVDFLSHSLALAQRSTQAVVSPVFEMLEGGRAYILVKEVERPATVATHGTQSLFGNTMTALLLIRMEALLLAKETGPIHPKLAYSAKMRSAAKPDNMLFNKEASAANWLDAWLLPRFKREISIDNASQPTVMSFEQQLAWRDMLTAEFLVILGLLACALLCVPALSLRHFRALERGAREHERSAYLATHDLLTGLPNRFLFSDRFEQAAQLHIRNGNGFALLLLDLDQFKEINDRHGHEVGDEVLVECARRMTAEIRACDTVARHGGDEFVALLANTPSLDDALSVAEKVRRAIARPLETSHGTLVITCSIGVALYPSSGDTLDGLRRAADQAMYVAKDSGRNTVSGHTQAGT